MPLLDEALPDRALPQRAPRWRRTAGAAGAAAVLLLCAGCGDDAVDEDAPLVPTDVITETPDLDVDDPG